MNATVAMGTVAVPLSKLSGRDAVDAKAAGHPFPGPALDGHHRGHGRQAATQTLTKITNSLG